MKYKLLETDVTRRGIKLFRIVALKDIPSIGIVKGARGGLIESERNLSQQGDCWIDYPARVYGQARVYQDAQIEDSAQVFEHACIYGSSIVSDNAIVCGHSKVYENAVVSDLARVYSNAKIYGAAEIYGHSYVYGDATVCGNAEVFGSSRVHGKAFISGYSTIDDDASVYGDAILDGHVNICGSTIITGSVTIDDPFNFSDADIYSQEDFSILRFQKFDSFVSYFSGDDIIYVRTNFTNYYSPDLEEGHTTLLREDLEYVIRRYFGKRQEYEELQQKALSLIALNELKMQSIQKEIIK